MQVRLQIRKYKINSPKPIDSRHDIAEPGVAAPATGRIDERGFLLQVCYVLTHLLTACLCCVHSAPTTHTVHNTTHMGSHQSKHTPTALLPCYLNPSHSPSHKQVCVRIEHTHMECTHINGAPLSPSKHTLTLLCSPLPSSYAELA